jgi:hypothetical protein
LAQNKFLSRTRPEEIADEKPSRLQFVDLQLIDHAARETEQNFT